MPRLSGSFGRVRSEAGFTLTELLVTIVIMGVAFAELVGGTLTGVIASDAHRKDANGGIVLTRFVDEVKAGPFHNCADKDMYVPPPADPEWRTGFVLSVADCVTVAGSVGLERITLVVESTSSAGSADQRSREEVQILKRDETP